MAHKDNGKLDAPQAPLTRPLRHPARQAAGTPPQPCTPRLGRVALVVALCTVLAPTCWMTAALLWFKPGYDHPLFWELSTAVAGVSHAATAHWVLRQHSRKAYVDRFSLMLDYRSTSQTLAGTLFLAILWGSGFFPDMLQPFIQGQGVLGGSLILLGTSVALAAIFSRASLCHTGARLFAALCMTRCA